MASPGGRPRVRSGDRPRAEWTLFRVAGIPVRAHVTLLLFVPFLAFLIATQLPAISRLPLVGADPDAAASALGGYGATGAGIAVALGLFAAVLLHELGHALLALRRGIPVRSITLWIFGGISHFEPRDRERPGQEAVIAAAGPLVSVVLGIALLGARLVIVDAWTGLVVGYLAFLNLVLGVFNLLPAFPLDGGRILRAALAARRPYVEATRTAATVGKALAVVMGFAGLFVNIFLIFIAFFVYMAASQEATQVELLAALEGVAVGRIMDRDPPVVDPGEPLDDLTERMLLTGSDGFPVVEDGRVVGVVTLTDVRTVPPVERATTRVGDVMTRDVRVADPQDPATKAFEEMTQRRLGRLLVLGPGGRLEGVVTLQGLVRAFEIARMTH